MLSTIVTSSAAGNASHTPVIPNAADNTNANIRIATKPLMIDDTKAHLTASTALSADVREGHGVQGHGALDRVLIRHHERYRRTMCVSE